MMYYVSVYTNKAVSDLQKKLVEAAKEWEGALVNGDEAKKKCIENFKLLVDRYNKEFSKCKSCRLVELDNEFWINDADWTDYTFVCVEFNEV